MSSREDDESEIGWSRESSVSPLAGKGKSTIRVVRSLGSPTKVIEKIKRPQHKPLFVRDSEDEEAETTDGAEGTTEAESGSDSETDGVGESEEEDADEEEEKSEDEQWQPAVATPKASRASALTKKLGKLKLDEDWSEEDSMVVLPESGSSNSNLGEKKKKRLLGKGKVMKEDEIEQAAFTAPKRAIRRS